MDPDRTWRDLLEALADGNAIMAAEHAETLSYWIARKGFAPAALTDARNRALASTQPQLPLDSPPLARTSDPVQSHQTVASIRADRGLARDIIDIVKQTRDSWYAAERAHRIRLGDADPQWLRSFPGCQDDDLVDRLTALRLRPQQRNVISRARGLLEHPDNGAHIWRLPSRIGRTGRPTVTYTLNPELYP